MGVLNQNIIAYAANHPWTNTILTNVEAKLQKGLLHYKYKEECTKEEYLYWYPSLNSGLPVVEKPDQIHQAIYMFHDMVHTCLYDPLPDTSFQTYLIGKMVGEVTAQFIADGIFASILKNEFASDYPYEKRYYLQFYECIKEQPPQQILIALAYFAIFGDRTRLLVLCDGDRNTKKWMHVYCNLYRKMFEADLWWNYQIFCQLATKKYTYTVEHCYRNNRPIQEASIEAMVTHNMYLLNQEEREIRGNGIALAQELSPNNPMLYQLVTVNYKNKIEPTILTQIRANLKE